MNNLQIQNSDERHIMISYNEYSSDICQQICCGLKVNITNII